MKFKKICQIAVVNRVPGTKFVIAPGSTYVCYSLLVWKTFPNFNHLLCINANGDKRIEEGTPTIINKNGLMGNIFK